ncbi:MAG: hypothetical protein IPM97_02640 [Bdellovibrionaceae bacterium]|nr:hypothetical protein [Pseudobdellovibrionaceae bacterium]
MYTRKNSNVPSLVAMSMALVLMTLSYQNCARARFEVDPAAKALALDKENVFGIDPSVGIGNQTGIDPNVPGVGNGGGIDPNVGGQYTTTGPLPISFIFECSNSKSRTLGTNLIKATAVKLVITSNLGQKACEIQGDIKNQILNKKTLTFMPCPGLAVGKYVAYLVEASVSSNYAMKSLTENDIEFEVKSNGTYYVANRRVEILYDLNTQNSSYSELNGLLGNTSTADTQKSCDSRSSPLIISMDSNSRGIKLTAPMDGIQFDILGQRSAPVAHAKKQISWLQADQEYYFIALPNERGQVLGIDEMFGDNTRGPDGKYSANGYSALAKYDDDRDGLITPDDEIFAKLRLWNDNNRDGVSQDSELFSLAEKKISIVDLHYDKRYKEQDIYGNQTLMKSVVKTEDGKMHLLFDLWFRHINITK